MLVVLVLHAQNNWAQETDTLCAGSAGMKYEVDAHPGNFYFWSIQGGKIMNGYGTSTITVNWDKTPGMGELTVSEMNPSGCYSDPVVLKTFLRGKIFQTQYPNAACMNDSILVMASGGLNYLWGDGSTDSIYKFKLRADTLFQVIISDTSCGMKFDTLPIKIKLHANPDADFSTDISQIMINQQVRFNYKGNYNDKVSWEFQKATTPKSSHHDIKVIFTDTGLAGIKLISINQFGCIDSTMRYFEIHAEQLYFPNAFTPNDDGLNDVFKPFGSGISTYRLRIYNRWGECIYDGNEKNIGWDGTFKHQAVMQDNYNYYCEAESTSGSTSYFTGQIALIR